MSESSLQQATKDGPVDGLRSVSVYNAQVWYEPNSLDADNLSSVNEKRRNFGLDPDRWAWRGLEFTWFRAAKFSYES
jgi:hypothetical protein